MKRFLFITLVLLCVFCAGAMAEESYLYPIRENGKWGYMDRQGTTVIEPRWGTVTGFVYEYAMVSSGNDFSVIRRDGTIAAGPYTVADRGKEVKINPRSFSIGKVVFDCITGKALTCPPDFEGILDDEYADQSTNLLLCVNDDCYGYIDRTTGEWAIPPVYNDMSQDLIHGSAFYGLTDETSLAQFRNGYAVVGVDRDIWLINERNERIPLPAGCQPDSSVIDGYFTVILLADDGDHVYKEGIADVSGNVLFLTDQYIIMRLQEGGVAVAFPSYDEVTFVDMQGNQLMEPVEFFSYERNIPHLDKGYFSMEEDTTLGTALCSTKAGKLWYDSNSRIVWYDPDTDTVVVYYDPDEEGEQRFLGNTILQLDHRLTGRYAELYPYWTPRNADYTDNDLCCFWLTDMTVSLYQTEQGETIYEKYFSEGLQAAAIRSENGEVRYGYIDTSGEFEIWPEYITAGNYLNGLALVTTEKGLQYIDHDGYIIWHEYKDPAFDELATGHINGIRLGMTVDQLRQEYGEWYKGDVYYHFKEEGDAYLVCDDPSMTGVSVMKSFYYDSIQMIRSTSFDVGGIKPGASRDAVVERFGKPYEESVVDEEYAFEYGCQTGHQMTYSFDGYRVPNSDRACFADFLFDEAGSLYCLQLEMGH